MSTQGATANSKTRSAKELPRFREGEIVWAKVRGYSWWPAKVSFL